MPGPPDDGGHTETSFANRTLGVFEGRHATIGPCEYFSTVISREDHDGIVSLPDLVQVLQNAPDAVVHLCHARFFQSVVTGGVHHRLVFRRDVGKDVHAGGVVPDEKRLTVFFRLVHKAVCTRYQHFVKGLHVVLGLTAFLPVLPTSHVREWWEGTFIYDLLLSNHAPPRLHCAIYGIGRPAVRYIARPRLVDPVLRVVKPVRIGHRVKVIEVTEKLVEAMEARKILVEVAEVVLTKLAGPHIQGLSGRWPASQPYQAYPHLLLPGRQSSIRCGSATSPVMKLARPAVQLASA